MAVALFLRMLRGGSDIGLLSARIWCAEIRELAANARLVGNYAVTQRGVRGQCQDHVHDVVPQRASVKAREIECDCQGDWGNGGDEFAHSVNGGFTTATRRLKRESSVWINGLS